MFRSFFLSFLFLFTTNLYAQNIPISGSYPQNYFRYPLDIMPSLAGSFGEIRANHFHSGLDFRTNQREGLPVYAVAEGYVSRLRVQIGGFGNAIYLSHPNGYTTVYAHLQRFNERITQIIKRYQYSQQSFSVDFPLLSIEIQIKKGEVIGWSGNTGSSGGPHLHFEIRDSETEKTLNPQLFGLTVKDNVKPVITGLYLYRLNGLPFNENTPRQYFQLSGSAGNYKLNKSPVINFSGEAAFGIITYDQQVAGGNQNGVYSIELQLDGKAIYTSAVEGFFFDNSRAANSHVDYPVLLKTGRRIQKSFIEPGNPLTIYKEAQNNGIIKLIDEEIHEVVYLVKDVKGNTSRLSFEVKNNPTATLPTPKRNSIQTFNYNKVNSFNTENIKIEIPPGSLYSDIEFNYSQSPNLADSFSAVHHIHTKFIPVHSPYDLWIKADSNLKESLRDKALITDTRRINYGGAYEDGFIKTTSKSFGSFYISVDTIAPVIKPVNISDKKTVTGLKKMIFKISDNLSGLGSFEGTIDGQWILMEFDPKTRTLWHTFDERTLPGEHQFQLLVTDLKANTNNYNITFYR